MARREITLKQPDVCVGCKGAGIAVGCEWEMGAPSGTASLDRGRPGVSAQREYERRRRGREADTRARHPHIGGFLLAVRTPPQHETAFRVGAEGERIVAAALERRTEKSGALILHDRRMPRGYGNVDHLAVAPSGVFVIDAKNHGSGKVSVTAPLIGKPKLLIDGRNYTSLIDGLDRQVGAVRTRLLSESVDLPVQGVLCFTKADLPLVFTLKMRGHLILYPKGTAKRINASGTLTATRIHEISTMLARLFPPA